MLKFEVTVTGDTREDLELALDEMLRRGGEGAAPPAMVPGSIILR